MISTAARAAHGAAPPVLVLDGFWRKTVAIVRGLSAAGERVICGEVTSLAPALRSRHVWRTFRYPSPLTQPVRFRDAVRRIVVEYAPDVMIVGECSTLAALGPIRDELSQVLHIVAPTPEWEKTFGDKRELARFAEKRGVRVPRTACFEDGQGIEGLPSDFPFPARFKPARGEGSVGQLTLADRSELAHWRERDLSAGVLQEELPPPRAKVGLGLLLSNGEIIASFAYRKERELYAAGGASTMRVSIIDEALVGIAERLFEETGYSGFLHLEFFLQRLHDEPILIEANPRPWGSLSLAIDAGVNFPMLAVRSGRGLAVRSPGYRENVRACWLLPGDLLARLRCGWGRPDDWPGARFDLLRDDDPGPAVARVFSFVVWLFHPHFRRCRRRR